MDSVPTTATPEAPRLRSRFRTDRVARKIKVADHDVYTLKSFAHHYHYLSAEWLCVLKGHNYNRTTKRCNQMRYPPNNMLRLAPEQAKNPRFYSDGPLFLCIADNGIKTLNERGIETNKKRVTPHLLRHQVMIDQVMASIEIGVNETPELELMWWDEILETNLLPEETRKSRSPYVKLSDKDGEPRTLRADGYPFVIKRTFDILTEYMFFIGIEADCDTESLRVIQDKFKGYLEMLRDKLYYEHFGSKTCFVIVAAPHEVRKRQMMEVWEKLTEKHRGFRKSMLFVKHPTFQSLERPRAGGQIITEPLARAGLPPITLSKQEV